MSNSVNRRSFLRNSLLSLGGIYVGTNFISCSNDDDVSDIIFPTNLSEGNFDHGVASFDPTNSQVIIWTRYNTSEATANIAWQISYDVDFSSILRSGNVVTSNERDYTVAVEVQDLSADKKIYYRFAHLGDNKVSVIGETITLPLSPNEINFALCSCSNYPYGYFNVYKEIANSEADIVLHLGDYIYEYANGEYGTTDFTSVSNRQVQPSHELLSLDDYRMRYKQYRTDENLKLAHQKKPFICVWDDHEIANDTWMNGAENHNDGEGSFETRKANAIQAYSEYLPLRTTDYNKIYRNFEFGNLMNLIMLDTRVVGRDEQLSYANYFTPQGFNTADFQQDWLNPNRTILGATQKQWLMNTVAGSGASWQVLGQQVLMGKVMIPAELLPVVAQVQAEAEQLGSATPETFAYLNQLLTELVTLKTRYINGDPTLTPEEIARISIVLPYNLDAWDGYPAERTEIFNSFGSKKVISLAGDTHNGWANKLSGVVGTEFATSSISSPGFEKYLGSDAATLGGFEFAMQTLADDVNYLNAGKRGYILLNVTHAAVNGEWRFVDTVFSQAYSVSTLNTETFTG